MKNTFKIFRQVHCYQRDISLTQQRCHHCANIMVDTRLSLVASYMCCQITFLHAKAHFLFALTAKQLRNVHLQVDATICTHLKDTAQDSTNSSSLRLSEFGGAADSAVAALIAGLTAAHNSSYKWLPTFSRGTSMDNSFRFARLFHMLQQMTYCLHVIKLSVHHAVTCGSRIVDLFSMCRF